MKQPKRFLLMTAAALFAIAVWMLGAYIREQAKIRHTFELCEEYLAAAEIDLSYSVRFGLLWEELVYGQGDYVWRDIDSKTASHEDRLAVEAFVASLEYDVEYNKDTSVKDGCESVLMDVEVMCANGGRIVLSSNDRRQCRLTAYDAFGQYLDSAGYIVDGQASDALRQRGGLPPIPTLDQIIEAGERQRAEEAAKPPEVIVPTWER